MIYYIRQPDKKVEEYFIYENTFLTKVGEILHGKIDNWRAAVIWMRGLYEYKS